MKTSHKSDELKNFKKGEGPQIGYLYYNTAFIVEAYHNVH
jgi:hypothetical protein